MINLVEKYNVPCPRYTSYPTVPYWEEELFSLEKFKDGIKRSFCKNNEGGISLYIHLPYCESLCTYCGCNTRITINHAVERPYIEAILSEWEMYKELFPERPKIKEIHLGGGTPTFFSAENLKKLIDGILFDCELIPNYEFSFEGHPNYTSELQLRTLYDLGFTRVSFGVQDFDINVQKIINRIQSFETVERVTQLARNTGYTSVNYDLIYGLPKQNERTIRETIEKVIRLSPDRIAFYSYAHVPWIKKGQRMFTENDLPSGDEKLKLYSIGRSLLEAAGYKEIGMDHFALENDDLYKAMKEKRLHRNFMGYTTSSTKLLIGLGVSSISDSFYSYAQNVKVVEEYMELVSQNKWPVFKGHIMTDEDIYIRSRILNIINNFETGWKYNEMQSDLIGEIQDYLKDVIEDQLVQTDNSKIQVLEKGRPFLRNICMAFDVRLHRKKSMKEEFSKLA